MKQIKLAQQLLERNVPSSFVTKLYNMCYRQMNDLKILTDDSFVSGNIMTGYTYDKYIELINEYFPSLMITPEGVYISFEDSLVESKIVNELMPIIYPNKTYEGVIAALETLNSGNASLLGFRQIFKYNTEITSFDELSKLYNVKALANEEFYGCSNLHSIDLTNIESFGPTVFRNCNNLEYFNGINSEKGTLRLPHLKSSGLPQHIFRWDRDSSNIFRGPAVIQVLDLGDCENFPGGAFFHINSLTYIDDSIFAKIKTFGESSVSYCENLVIDDLKLPSCTSISYAAFEATPIKKISELGICSIGQRAFYTCSKLATITDEVFANITSIGREAFYNCTNLVIEDLKLPLVSSIGTNAFYNTKLKKVSDLGSCIVVGGFSHVTTLQTVNLPATCNELGDSAFNGCTSLQLPDCSLIKYFGSWCFANIPQINGIIYNDRLTLGYEIYYNTGVHSMYMPCLINTNGAKSTDFCSIYRGQRTYCLGSTGHTTFIIYVKDLQKIHGAFLGGYTFAGKYGLDQTVMGISNNQAIWEYQGEPQWESLDDTHQDPYDAHDRVFANCKYLVINRMTPPAYYNTFGYWGGGLHGSWSLYMKDPFNVANETFHYLCVPRAAIETYKTWDALNPQFNTGVNAERLTEENRTELKNLSDFDVNTRIIAIESMGHFATKAEYDASTISNKNEYLIEEYMGLGPGETINWDSTPTWSA